jgi:hypothetical protein
VSTVGSSVNVITGLASSGAVECTHAARDALTRVASTTASRREEEVLVRRGMIMRQ